MWFWIWRMLALVLWWRPMLLGLGVGVLVHRRGTVDTTRVEVTGAVHGICRRDEEQLMTRLASS